MKRTKKVKADIASDIDGRNIGNFWELPRTPEAYDAMVDQMAKAMATYTWKP